MSISEYYDKTGEVLINVLHRELQAASVPIDGTAWLELYEQVRVDYQDSATSGDMTAGEAIVAAHVPIDPIQEVADAAETNAGNIPGWAHWTEAEAETWFNTNIDTPLADARTSIDGLAALNITTFKAVINGLLDILDSMATMIWAMARMIIALRNKTWPNLQE